MRLFYDKKFYNVDCFFKKLVNLIYKLFFFQISDQILENIFCFFLIIKIRKKEVKNMKNSKRKHQIINGV